MGLQLVLYSGLTRVLGLAAPAHLRRRLARGAEDPVRWREKLGEASAPRPPGRLVWLHGVGVGEVMALRGLVLAMAGAAPDLSFLITSTARSSGQVIAANLPPRTQHQYLALDAPRFAAAFLDHWHPDLSVWAEQDLWPGLVTATHRRGVPLALVNARMNAQAFAGRRWGRGLLRDVYARFSMISAQDDATMRHLGALGAANVRVTGSLKAAAPPLSVVLADLEAVRGAVAGRRVWLAASTHAADEAVVLAAHRALVADDAGWLLVLVPRVPDRRAEIVAAAQAAGLETTLRSKGQTAGGQVHLADTFGELGLWYRISPITLMGGTFGPVEGHNPWEPAALGSAILHGPRVANFAADYAELDRAGAARPVTADTLMEAVKADYFGQAAKARALSLAARDSLEPLARDLVALMVSPMVVR